MKLLASHDQRVADLPADDQEDHLLAFDIVQDAKIPCSQFEFGQGIGSQPLDGLRWDRRLIHEAHGDGGLQCPTFAGGQSPKLFLGLPRDCDPEGHRRLQSTASI
jgi:hypothetical protein